MTFQEVDASVSSARGFRRLTLFGSAAMCGLSAGLMFAMWDAAALVSAVALGAALLSLVARLAYKGERSTLLTLVTLALATHVALALLINAFAPGHDGFVTGDDAGYYALASRVALYIRGVPLDPNQGPPGWGGDAYLFGGFVYLETGLFLVFGSNVRIPLLLNGAIAVATALLVYASASQLFGRRPALVAATIVAFYPSLVLWSSLNLKDPLAAGFLSLALSAVIAVRTRPGVPLLILPFVAAGMLVVVSPRGYAALTVVIAALLNLALAPSTRPRRVAALAVVLGLMLFAATISIGKLDQTLSSLEDERGVMAVGARTAFVPTPAPAPTRSTAEPTAGPATAEQPVLVRTLAYLPIGLGYAIFAPVPFATGGLHDLLTAPEMLAWYVLVVAALVTVWRERRRWTLLLPAILTIAGLILVFALAEGNAGTLFRHRGMVVPLVVLLASPTLVWVWMRVRRPKPEDGP